MHMNGYIAIVKTNGHILRESHGNVYLPFNTEYSLLLKNKNDGRAIVSVFIDGADVLGGSELIIPAFGGEINLERFMIDGDLHSGQKFKFVSANNSEVADPTNSENGEIKLIFWPERKPLPPIQSPTVWAPWRISLTDNSNNSGFCKASEVITTYSNTLFPQMRSSYIHTDFESQDSGATIEGGNSNQKFTAVYSNGKGYPSTIIKLKLNPSKQIQTTSIQLFCSKCGIRISYDANYCSSCGQKVL